MHTLFNMAQLRYQNTVMRIFIIVILVCIVLYSIFINHMSINYYDAIKLFTSSIQVLSLKEYRNLMKDHVDYDRAVEVIDYIKIARSYLPSYDLEEYVLNSSLSQLQSNLPYYASQYHNHSSSSSDHDDDDMRIAQGMNPPVLCATFIELTWKSIDRVILNMQQIVECRWLLIVYKVNTSDKIELMNYFESQMTVLFTTSNSKSSSSNSNSNSNINSNSNSNIMYEFIFAPSRKVLLTQYLSLCHQQATHQPPPPHHYHHHHHHCHSLQQVSSSFSSIPIPFNGRIYPKILLFILLLPYLSIDEDGGTNEMMDMKDSKRTHDSRKDSKHHHVWILDGDISLEGFSLSEFMMIHHCALDGLRPLIAQPLISESTQTYPYLNSHSWNHPPEKKMTKMTKNDDDDKEEEEEEGEMMMNEMKEIASQTGFLEIQAPMIDALFLRWFIHSFIIPMVVPAHILGADWGFDALFCRAATIYRRVYMKREFLSSSSSSSSSSSPSSSSSSPSSSSSSRDVSLKASIDILLDSLDGEDGGHHGLAAGSSCLLILRGLAHNVSIHHEDSRETNSIIGQSIKTILNKEMMRIIKKTYPRISQLGQEMRSNPLTAGSVLRRIAHNDSAANRCFRAYHSSSTTAATTSSSRDGS